MIAGYISTHIWMNCLKIYTVTMILKTTFTVNFEKSVTDIFYYCLILTMFRVRESAGVAIERIAALHGGWLTSFHGQENGPIRSRHDTILRFNKKYQ